MNTKRSFKHLAIKASLIAAACAAYALPRLSLAAVPANTAPSVTPFTFKAKTIENKEFDGSKLKGSVLLVANTASKCGFTPQYKDLEGLYEKYKDQGLVVLGFPSNDFGNTEPGTNAEIKSFCQLKYGVTFPIFSKGSVSGEQAQPLFVYLTTAGGKDLQGPIEWNFEKFLVDRNGTVRYRFGSQVNPLTNKVTTAVEGLLNEKAKS